MYRELSGFKVPCVRLARYIYNAHDLYLYNYFLAIRPCVVTYTGYLP